MSGRDLRNEDDRPQIVKKKNEEEEEYICENNCSENRINFEHNKFCYINTPQQLQTTYERKILFVL